MREVPLSPEKIISVRSRRPNSSSRDQLADLLIQIGYVVVIQLMFVGAGLDQASQIGV